MKIEEIFDLIKNTKGTNAKKNILRANKDNKKFLKALVYALDPFKTFNIVKIPQVDYRDEGNHINSWEMFFDIADKCSKRQVTGNEAINLMLSVFRKTHNNQEKWMRCILKKNLAIGISEKTANSVIKNLIPTFEVSLAQKFDFKRIKSDTIAIEPKLDGIRCMAVVEDSKCIMYARSGKQIINFEETIGKELEQLGDGCYDGEIMGKDFISLMRQAYRKESIETDGTYFAMFDYVPLNEWKSKKSTMSTQQRYDELITRLSGSAPSSTGMNIPRSTKKYLKPVERKYINANEITIKKIHDDYVDQGYEGVMVKDVDAVYKFGRGYEVMKFKSFHDVDLPIKKLLEGTGKHSGKLGSVVVTFNDVDVQVGSGFSDKLRKQVWENKDLFIGRIIEVRYQEVTADGSLRFPTFVCFRNDR
tara:strand:+ start:52 stop:1305 length:1254 start_codon:yes stop_codon:yes gene_type:complete